MGCSSLVTVVPTFAAMALRQIMTTSRMMERQLISSRIKHVSAR